MELGVRSAGEAFLHEWMGAINYRKWLRLAMEIQSPSQRDFIEWLLTAADETLQSHKIQAESNVLSCSNPSAVTAAGLDDHFPAVSIAYEGRSRPNVMNSNANSVMKHEMSASVALPSLNRANTSDKLVQQKSIIVEKNLNRPTLQNRLGENLPDASHNVTIQDSEMPDAEPKTSTANVSNEDENFEVVHIKSEVECFEENIAAEQVGEAEVIGQFESPTQASNSDFLSDFFVVDETDGDLSVEHAESCRSKDASGNDIFLCPNCAKVFDKRFWLVRHYRTHSGFQPYMCKLCGKTSNQKSNLMGHLVKFHGLTHTPSRRPNNTSSAS